MNKKKKKNAQTKTHPLLTVTYGHTQKKFLIKYIYKCKRTCHFHVLDLNKFLPIR